MGEIPLRIKRIRTSLPEEHVAVSKKKAAAKLGLGSSYSDKQHLEFEALLRSFQKGSEDSRVDIDLDVQVSSSPPPPPPPPFFFSLSLCHTHAHARTRTDLRGETKDDNEC